MTEDESYAHLFASLMFKQWHWFRWHFEHRLRGRDHPLARSVVRALLDCDARIPGYACVMLDRLASISGRERYRPHWEQLLQLLSEVHVVRQVLTFEWPETATFSFEPSVDPGGKNPELSLQTADGTYGIEVKAPALFDHWQRRSDRPMQMPARSVAKEILEDLAGSSEKLTLPRDNPVKDFLLSANAKFDPLKKANAKFFGILVVVWDDFIYEPISALIHPESGLLTANSFARDTLGGPVRFEAVDGVVAIRHLHQLVRACRDEPLQDRCEHALDYGRPGEFPFKVFLQNPHGATPPASILKCLQALTPDPSMGAEYLPTDAVWWFEE